MMKTASALVCAMVFALVVASAFGAAPQNATDGLPPDQAVPSAAPSPVLVSPVLTDRPDAPSDELLGPPYVSPAAGISICPPAGARLLGRVDADHIAQWVDESRHWVLKLSRITLAESRPLQSYVDARSGQPVKGLLDVTVENLKRDLPGGTILRQDVTTFAGGQPILDHSNDPVLRDPALKKLLLPTNPTLRDNVGIVVIRYTSEAQRHLTQEALIQANDQLYYVLTLTTPGSAATDTREANDPQERTAVETFRQMLDSVHLLDLGAIRRDQDDRLFRTRTFFVNLTPEKIRAALVPEQWFRILLRGKDVGYTYIVEETASGVPKSKVLHLAGGKTQVVPDIHPGDDILIGIRSRATVDGVRSDQSRGPIQTDSEAWLFVTADRNHEDWSKLEVLDDFKSKKKTYTEEFGASDRRSNSLKHEGATLSVSQVGTHGNREPINRELPPFYLPQALGHLLPRILPLRVPKTYAFATFVSDAREVMFRYVDVREPQNVVLGGHAMTAIPVADRVGLEGSITYHYMSPTPDPEGRYRYLGSDNKETKISVVATDAATLQRIWANANLTRPGGVSQPGSAAPAEPAPEELPKN